MRFVELPHDEILDTKTNLIWQKFYNKCPISEIDELIEDFDSKYRLPLVHELLSLVDHSFGNPASSFPNTMAANYLSIDYDSSRYFVNFKDGDYKSISDEKFFVRLVRDNE